MPSTSLAPLSGRYLSFAEREEIAILQAQGCGVREIARRPVAVDDLGSCAATPRPAAAGWSIGPRPRSGTPTGVPGARRRPSSPATTAAGATCRTGLPAGHRARRHGGAGPEVRWIGRRHGRRQDRRWARSWSPEQIAGRLRVDFPDDESMRISHEAIYQALYVQGRGALRRELTACLRTGRALRVPRARTRGRGKRFVTPEVLISQRPGRGRRPGVPGHWEGDLILGLDSSAIGTLVERTTAVHDAAAPAPHGRPRRRAPDQERPRAGRHGAEAVRDAIAASIATLPEQLRRSLTWDQGAEMAQHAQLRIDTGLQVFFCDPHSPWQRGTNENTNGLLRQYFPKGTDLSSTHAATSPPSPPRSTPGPARPSAGGPQREALNELLRSIQRGGVATTP